MRLADASANMVERSAIARASGFPSTMQVSKKCDLLVHVPFRSPRSASGARKEKATFAERAASFGWSPLRLKPVDRPKPHEAPPRQPGPFDVEVLRDLRSPVRLMSHGIVGSRSTMPAERESESKAPETIYKTRSGASYTHVDSLPSEERELMRQCDPVRKYGLNADTALYRVTEERYVVNNRMAGHEGSSATIVNHQAIGEQTNPYTRETYIDLVEMPASELKDPSLNVVCGSDWRLHARHYVPWVGAFGAKTAVVKMRYGDFVDAGGGMVFDDLDSRCNTENIHPLIVTLPTGRTVPVEVVTFDATTRPAYLE
jgi:hypothetical protein